MTIIIIMSDNIALSSEDDIDLNSDTNSDYAHNDVFYEEKVEYSDFIVNSSIGNINIIYGSNVSDNIIGFNLAERNIGNFYEDILLCIDILSECVISNITLMYDKKNIWQNVSIDTIKMHDKVYNLNMFDKMPNNERKIIPLTMISQMLPIKYIKPKMIEIFVKFTTSVSKIKKSCLIISSTNVERLSPYNYYKYKYHELTITDNQIIIECGIENIVDDIFFTVEDFYELIIVDKLKKKIIGQYDIFMLNTYLPFKMHKSVLPQSHYYCHLNSPEKHIHLMFKLTKPNKFLKLWYREHNLI
jgi:hypothetical protein